MQHFPRSRSKPHAQSNEGPPLTFINCIAGGQSYPIKLCKLALHYHCVPASSAPVERVFNTGGQIFRPVRNRLSDKAFEQLMFIKCNKHLWS